MRPVHSDTQTPFRLLYCTQDRLELQLQWKAAEEEVERDKLEAMKMVHDDTNYQGDEDDKIVPIIIDFS